MPGWITLNIAFTTAATEIKSCKVKFKRGVATNAHNGKVCLEPIFFLDILTV